jgi:hypothetical protein
LHVPKTIESHPFSKKSDWRGGQFNASILPVTPAFDPTRKLRRRLWLWRCLVGVLVIALGWLWVRSWSGLDVWSVPVGKGRAEFFVGGSAVAGALVTSSPGIIEFGGRIGSLDEKHQFHYAARWIDGPSLGEVSAPCVGPPHVKGLTTADLDRWGSFGCGGTGTSDFFFRCPIWPGLSALLVCWLWLEHSIRRRLKLASLPPPE